jgi:G3E family GTPase
VIVNEFGEIGLDHLLIEQAFENTLLLKNGCICCTVRGDVADTLETLFARVKTGELPPFRRIAIETTGLADPAPLAHTVVTEGAAYACRLDGIVTTVDAVHGGPQLARQTEARNQVAMADRILLTMADLASPTEAAAAETAVRTLNPTAPLHRVVLGDIAADHVFGLSPETQLTASGLACWIAAPPPGNALQHAAIFATMISSDGPVRWPALRLWLDSVLSVRGADILRLKGLVHVEGADRPLLLQAVHHVLHPPRWLERHSAIPLETKIVLITQGDLATGLHRSFRAALAEPAAHLVIPNCAATA